jgi:hypothetical protein
MKMFFIVLICFIIPIDAAYSIEIEKAFISQDNKNTMVKIKREYPFENLNDADLWFYFSGKYSLFYQLKGVRSNSESIQFKNPRLSFDGTFEKRNDKSGLYEDFGYIARCADGKGAYSISLEAMLYKQVKRLDVLKLLKRLIDDTKFVIYTRKVNIASKYRDKKNTEYYILIDSLNSSFSENSKQQKTRFFYGTRNRMKEYYISSFDMASKLIFVGESPNGKADLGVLEFKDDSSFFTDTLLDEYKLEDADPVILKAMIGKVDKEKDMMHTPCE